MLHYLKLLLKRVFRFQFEVTDFISTILTAIFSALGYMYPKWNIDTENISWQITLSLFGLALFFRLICAPYFLWKEEFLKNICLEAKLEEPGSVRKILGQRTYSEADKHSISNMFRELRMLLDVEIRQTEMDCQVLAMNIPKISCINSIDDKARQAMNAIAEVKSKLDDIERKISPERHIFKGIVGANIPNELTLVHQEIQRSMEPILAAQRLYALLPEKEYEFSKILEVVSSRIRDKTAKVNGWYEETLKKISLVEVELVKR